MSEAYAGEIVYFDGRRTVRGRERFIVDTSRDERSLLAHAVIDDWRLVERTVAYTVDRNWSPMSATVEVNLDGARLPSALYAFNADRARLTTSAGHRSELTIKGGIDWFGAHPIVMDGWIISRALAADTRGTFALGGGVTSSVEHDGASDPGLNAVIVHGRYIGACDVEVEAGRFSCHEVELTFGTEFREPHPAYTLWVRAEPDHILVRAEIPAFDRTYELVRLMSFDSVHAGRKPVVV